jgi:amidase
VSSLAEDTRWLDATDQAALVRSGHVSAAELLEAAIERIQVLDPGINAVVMKWFDQARATASGDLPAGVFRGVPFLLKDLMAAYAGAPLAGGNRRLKEASIPSAADTTLVSRFRAAGLVIAGRTNCSEFGSLPVTEPLAWGPARNPWRPTRSPGGSSGGSAAAVASGMVPIAHATDGAGSIRIPASCCGLVRLKPSQGRITSGPLGDEAIPAVQLCVSRTVRDTARILDAVHGPGVGDTVIAPAPARPYVRELGADPGGLRIGLLDHYPSGDAVQEACATAVREAAGLLESLGHRIETDFPAALASPGYARGMSALRGVEMAVLLGNLEQQLGREVTADDVEPVNWEQAQQAPAISGTHYARALQARTHYRRAIQQWWADGFDLLLTPTLGELPPPVGSLNALADPAAVTEYSLRCISFTKPFNISGQPAISLPLHWTPRGLPVGVQLVAAYGQEDVLLRVASQLEQARPWADRRPPAALADH